MGTTITPLLTAFDWLKVIQDKRDKATSGDWQPLWEEIGPPIGIVAHEMTWNRSGHPDYDDTEAGVVTAVVALLAWDADGEELPKFEENIDYIAELHNQFPRLATELYNQRNHRRAAEARAEAAEYKLATIRAMATRGVPNCINLYTIDRVLNEPTTPTMIDMVGTGKEVPRG